MGRLFLLFVAWLIQASLIVLLLNADWLQRQTSAEQKSIEAQLGQERAAKVLGRARSIYDEWFTSTWVRQQSYGRLLPDPTRPKDGMENLAPWFFDWLRQRLDAFWALVFLGTLRAQLCREWAPLLVTGILAAVVDGLTQRRIKRINHALASADKYLTAKFGGFALLLCWLTYLSAPIAITPMFVPAWAACLSLTCMLLTAHAQHRI